MSVTVNFHLDPIEPPHSTPLGTQLNATEILAPGTGKSMWSGTKSRPNREGQGGSPDGVRARLRRIDWQTRS